MGFLEAEFESNIYRNLIAFKEHYPDIFEHFKDYKEERYFVVYDDDNSFNIYDSISGCNLYSDDPLKSLSDQLSEYIKDPIYFSINYGASTDLSRAVNPVHVEYTNRLSRIANIQSAVLKRNNKLPNRIKSFVAVSTGIGFDLQQIALEYDVRNLYILEPDSDLFYASMHFIRWDLIVSRYSDVDDGRKLFICIAPKDDIISIFHDQFFRNGRFNANSTYLYNSVYIEENNVVLSDLKDEIASGILMGFGFYDDSRLSLAATIGNLKNKVPCLGRDNIKGHKDYSDVPVFIIGAGPSLDSDISFIKNNENKAIIISCGSGVKVLERANIKPDFHFECERTAFTKHWLDQVGQDYLKKIFFIGLNIIYPGVFDLFEDKGMILKTFETGSTLMSEASKRLTGDNQYPLFTNVNPTVVHMGVGIAPIFGFRKIYLFGTDMGYTNPDKHHSDLSSYSDLKDEHKSGFTPKEHDVFEVIPNFEGEQVYSDRGFTAFRMALEKILGHTIYYKGLEYFNCSNGAKIKGTAAVKSSDIILSNEIDKERIIDEIKNNYFSKACDDEVCEKIEEIVNDGNFNSFCKSMIDYLSVEVSSQAELDDLISGFVDSFFISKDNLSDDDSYVLTIFSGSLLYYFTVLTKINYYRTDDVGNNMDYVNMALSEIVSFINRVSDDFICNYKKNDDISYYNLF